jgi:hypothetical protein
MKLPLIQRRHTSDRKRTLTAFRVSVTIKGMSEQLLLVTAKDLSHRKMGPKGRYPVNYSVSQAWGRPAFSASIALFRGDHEGPL